MENPTIPDPVAWRKGMILEPDHFVSIERRGAALAHVAGLIGDPWPWGFLSVNMDETALAGGQLKVDCSGVFADGESFRAEGLSQKLESAQNGTEKGFSVIRNPESREVVLRAESGAATESSLPVAKLVYHGGVWSGVRDWSPPVLLVGPDHPMRVEMNHQLGSLGAIGAGFMTTLRMPGAEQRPAARMLGHVAAAITEGVGVIEAMLASPTITPGRVGLEALRMALGVRSAAGIFEPFDSNWDPVDQRGSIRRLLYTAEAAASGIGLPFRTIGFRAKDDSDILLAEGVAEGTVLLSIEASRPADLIAGRSWFEGAALASPERIQEAMTRRVAGCPRQQVERDPRIGISSGPLLALYYVENDPGWRANSPVLALAAKNPPPVNTFFSVIMPDTPQPIGALPSPRGQAPGAPQPGAQPSMAPPPGGAAPPRPGGDA